MENNYICTVLNHDQKQNTLYVRKDFQDQNKRGANFISKGLLLPEFKFELKERTFMNYRRDPTLIPCGDGQHHKPESSRDADSNGRRATHRV